MPESIKNFFDKNSSNLALPSIRVTNSVLGTDISTMRVGGNVSLYIETSSVVDLSKLLIFFYNNNITPRFLGNGSNIIFPDEGVNSAPVIKFLSGKNKYSYLSDLDCSIDFSDVVFSENSSTERMALDTRLQNISDKEVSKFRLNAGASLMSLSRIFTSASYHGLEFAAGIPASVGGAVKMNAGAHGSDMSEITHAVHCLDMKGEIITFKRDKINFTYRNSNLPDELIIVAADINLLNDSSIDVKMERDRALEYRKRTQPLTFPSSGSVFRNTETKAAGQILEELNLKGFKKGGVMYSELHANWIIKHEKLALASDVKYLVNLAKEKALNQLGLSLETEVIFWKP